MLICINLIACLHKIFISTIKEILESVKFCPRYRILLALAKRHLIAASTTTVIRVTIRMRSGRLRPIGPSSVLADAVQHTDESIGKILRAIRSNSVLANNTLVVLVAKHGQDPRNGVGTRL
ncbi:MAG: alkaline phosphatase family protein [Rhizonema sp. NSF051]|nr:alkaline phosphatase family protein [Rhizonema sp. NSF051]